MMVSTVSSLFSAGVWIFAILSVMEVTTTEAWTATTHPFSNQSRSSPTVRQKQAERLPPLLAKKKKKGGGGGSAAKGGVKVQVKMLQHVPGTGQLGEVVMVNPVFFDNKLRPNKLARKITDEEVQQDLENKQAKSDDLLRQATSLKDLLDDVHVLTFGDNKTGPDGKKLFGGIGPKKLMESLRKDCKEFDAYSKEFTKQVSILDVEEEETSLVADDEDESSGKYKDYSSSNDSEQSSTKTVVKYSSLPKKDKLTIKETGVYRMKVAITKDLFAKIKIVVE